MQEAEALQEEEQKRRRQQRMNSRRAAAKAGASGGESSSIHVSASAPNLVHGGGIKRSVIARVPLMGGNRQVEDGYETDHQDFCDVCQQVSDFISSYFPFIPIVRWGWHCFKITHPEENLVYAVCDLSYYPTQINENVFIPLFCSKYPEMGHLNILKSAPVQ